MVLQILHLHLEQVNIRVGSVRSAAQITIGEKIE
jgi:hypothetical protein